MARRCWRARQDDKRCFYRARRRRPRGALRLFLLKAKGTLDWEKGEGLAVDGHGAEARQPPASGPPWRLDVPLSSRRAGALLAHWAWGAGSISARGVRSPERAGGLGGDHLPGSVALTAAVDLKFQPGHRQVPVSIGDGGHAAHVGGYSTPAVSSNGVRGDPGPADHACARSNTGGTGAGAPSFTVTAMCCRWRCAATADRSACARWSPRWSPAAAPHDPDVRCR